MKANVKLSIIIPAYNTEKYIGECLESVVNQKTKNYEVIIIDDGSTDNTAKICDDYAKRYKQLCVIHTKNSGVSSARNLGIEKASGKMIWFIDSDDYIKPNSVTTIIEEAEKNDLLIFGIEEFNKERIVERRYGNSIATKEYAINQIISDTGIRGYPFNKVFRTDIINNGHLRFDKSIKNCEDLLFAIRYASLSKRIKIHNDILYCYRQRRGGAIHNRVNLEQSTATDAFLAISKDRNLSNDARTKAKALFVKAYYKYLPILSEDRKTKYEKDLNAYKQSKKFFSKKDKLLITGYHYFNPIMRLLHTPTAKGKDLYE